MSLHRPSPHTVSVRDLLEENGVQTSLPDRAYVPVGGRIRIVAGTAAATGAFLGIANPALAAAAPAAQDTDPTTNIQNPAAPFGFTGLPIELAAPLTQAEQALTQFEDTLQGLQEQIATAPAPAAPAPAAVRPVGGEISSEFGSRWGTFHNGVDIADTLGTPIRSAMGGTVLESGPASGFGLWVRILQDDGTTAVYGHINDYYVQAGDRVNAGDVIAEVGNRGYSTGPHLHLEIWDQSGYKIDPMNWLATNGVLTEATWGSNV